MEEVFDFREFVIKILRSFRLLFVLAILCAAAATSYKIYQVWSEPVAAQSVQTDFDRESKAVTEEQKAYLNDLIFYYEQHMQYLQNNLNILKEVDSKQLYVLQRVIMVDADIDIEYADRIAGLYVALSQDIVLYERLSDKLDTDLSVDYLRELVKIQSDAEQGFISIYITGASMDFCVAAANAVWEYINKEIHIGDIFDEPYSLILVNPEAKPYSDWSLLERKLEIIQKIEANTSALTTLKNELKKLNEAPVPITTTKDSVIKSILLYTALGFVIGLGIGLIWIFFFDVMDLRIRSSKEFNKKFGVKCLVEVYDERKHRLFYQIDERIDRLEGVGFEKPTEEQSMNILAASIEELAGETIRKVLLTGDLPSERLERLKAGLAEKMTRVDVWCAGDITVSPDSLRLTGECGGIVLVVRENESTYPNVEKQLKCFDNIGKKALGFVMVQ